MDFHAKLVNSSGKTMRITDLELFSQAILLWQADTGKAFKNLQTATMYSPTHNQHVPKPEREFTQKLRS